MNRKDRRAKEKDQKAGSVSKSYEELLRAGEAAGGEPVEGHIGGWKMIFSDHPKLGKHLSVSPLVPSASKDVLRAAKQGLHMPDKPEECSFWVSPNGVYHWTWGTSAAADVAREAMAGVVADEIPSKGYNLELTGDPPEEMGQEWMTIIMGVMGDAAHLATKLGLVTKNAHFRFTTPAGKSMCCHLNKVGDEPTPKHTLH